MQRILIIDSNNNNLKHAYNFISLLFPGTLIYPYPDISNALPVCEKEKIDLLFLSKTCMENQKLEDLIQKQQTPIIVLTESKKKKKDITGKYNRPEVVGELFIPEEQSISSSWIKNYIVDKNQSKTKPKTIVLPSAHGWFIVAPDSVVAVKKEDLSLTVYTRQQEIRKVKSSLSDILKHCNNDFVYINRKCAIDKKEITRLVPTCRDIYIRANNKEYKFEASRQRWKEVLEMFSDKEE